MTRIGSLALIAAFALAGAARAGAAPALSVCLEKDTRPFSYVEKGRAAGFDVAVAQAVAGHLGRDLEIRWFEIRNPPDSDDPEPSRAENALLHAGKCQLIGGFPLIENDLRPADNVSRMADFDGMTRADRKARIAIGPLIASKPYHYFPFTVLLGPKADGRKIHSLADLQGLRIGSEDGTLADAMLLWYGHRHYLRQVMHYMPAKPIEHGGGLLDHLDRGDIDATLVELRRYDVYRATHPGTRIEATGYYYRIGFNMGFVAPPGERALVDKVDGALDELMTKHELEPMAKAAGMTYVAPRQPVVANPVALGDLVAGDDGK